MKKLKKKLLLLGLLTTMSVARTISVFADIDSKVPIAVEIENSDIEPVVEESEAAASEEVNIAVEGEDTDSLVENTQAAELEAEQQIEDLKEVLIKLVLVLVQQLS